MTGRCKTCFWYDAESAGHSCTCPKVVYGYGNPPVDDDGVQVEDDEGWGFAPGPGFGCIHWESKEQVGMLAAQTPMIGLNCAECGVPVPQSGRYHLRSCSRHVEDPE